MHELGLMMVKVVIALEPRALMVVTIVKILENGPSSLSPVETPPWASSPSSKGPSCTRQKTC